MMTALATLQPPAVPTTPAKEEPLYEVVNSQKVELPPMSIYAVWIAARLQNRMGPFAEANGLGTVVPEGLFILDRERDLRRRPDVAFVSSTKWPLDRPLPETGDWEVIPDLAIEIISPNDLFEDVVAKMAEYFRLGVQEVWIVVPQGRVVYVYRSPTSLRVLTAADELSGEPLLPGLHLPVSSLFQPQSQPTPSTTTAES